MGSYSNPSFSSTLLDAIYRSIDESNEEEEEVILYRETMRKKKQRDQEQQDHHNMVNFQRASMIEKWMEKKVTEKVVFRRKSAADFERNSRNHHHHHHHSHALFFNSSSSSSDSSGFSSSDSSSCYGLQKPKPIRTVIQPKEHKIPKEGSNFVKTKSRALKIYGDLKKVKQPISPGGKLASFLNSLFTTGNPKKSKISTTHDENSARKSKSANGSSSTCSSASSFSRSCLSNKTSSSRGGKPINGGIKRSVRFYPVSVIVDEDSQPCGQKSLFDDKPSLEKFRNSDFLRNYHHQKKVDFDFDCHVHDDEEEDDDASYASSDLFELDNLSAIGMDHERYCEELPVYETTHIHTNRAIANGLIL